MNGLSIIVPVKEPEPFYPHLLEYLEILFDNIPHEILKQEEEGLTNAVVHGVARAKYNAVGVIDADGSHNPVEFRDMYLAFLENPMKDLVIGSKVLGSDDTGIFRMLVSAVFRWIASSMLDIHVTDCMSGIVIARKELMDNIVPTSDYKYALQILLKTSKVIDFPIHFEKRKSGKSKANAMQSIKILFTIFKLRVHGELK